MRTTPWRIGAGTAGVVLGALVIAARRIVHPPEPVPRGDRIRVAAVGDSITYGTGVLFSRGRSAYPAQLQRLLGDRYDVLNYGLNGRTLLDSGDMPYREEPFFMASQEVGPAIVLIMLGSNDAKPKNWNATAYAEQLEAMARTYAALPSAPEVHLMVPPAAFRNPYGITGSVVAGEIAPIVRDVAARTGAHLIDVYEATKDSPELFWDGVHPGVEGSRRIAEFVAAAICRYSDR